MKEKRFYNFIVVIYEDDENFDKQYFNLLQEPEVIYIRHDSDLNEETGEYKKPHYHFVIKLKNACTISALSKRILVQENMIEPVKKSFNGALKYLIHWGCEDKFQYDSGLVQSNSDKLLNKFLKLISEDIPEGEKVMNIQDYIINFDGFIRWDVLGKYVQKVNMWDAFRRNFGYFKCLVNDHNGKVAGEVYQHENLYYK